MSPASTFRARLTARDTLYGAWSTIPSPLSVRLLAAAGEVAAANGAALAGKVVIDATNNIGATETDSRAAIAAAAPDARYVRAFNTLGWENFADPPPEAVLFFAADPGGRPVAEQLITAVGLEPVFVGDAGATGAVDALLGLWFTLVKHNGGNRRVALRITR